MFKLQTQEFAWAAGESVRFRCGDLLKQLEGAPLHVEEIIIKGLLEMDGDAVTDTDPWEYVKSLARVEIVPNKLCGTSLVDGWTMQQLDWLLTGRKTWRDAPVVATSQGQNRYFECRLPYHGGLLGNKSRKWLDLITPVMLWLAGQVRITFSGATPFIGGATILSGAISVEFVCERIAPEYIVGPSVLYNRWDMSAGASLWYPSEGTTTLLALAPEDQDAMTNYPGTFNIEDRHLLSGEDSRQLASMWNAMTATSSADSISLASPEVAVLGMQRPGCAATQAQNEPWREGNILVQCPASVADPHVLIASQLHPAGDGVMREIVSDLGVDVPPAVDLGEAKDLAQAATLHHIAPTLPRRISRLQSVDVPMERG